MGVRALEEPRRLRAPARRRGRLRRLSAQPPPARRDRARFPVAAGLGDTPERERPLEATLWGEPPCGRATARLADGSGAVDAREVVGDAGAPDHHPGGVTEL